ncbi:MAG TPA: hypothetical protein VF848_10385 [Steroidobacteraceae bacterium]
MRILLLSMGLLVTGAAVAADDVEPAVQTSDAATAVPPPAKASSGQAAPRQSARVTSTNKVAASGSGKAQDRLELDPTQITGNKELPRQMFVVPWKRPNLGEFTGRPPNSLLDEVLAPVDRDVFRRQNRYFAALKPDTPQVAGPTPESATPTSGDEK